jgi:hypothetical protein
MNHYLLTDGEPVAYLHTNDLQAACRRHGITGSLHVQVLSTPPLISGTFDPPLLFTDEISDAELAYDRLMFYGLFRDAAEYRREHGLPSVKVEVKGLKVIEEHTEVFDEVFA